MTINMSQHQKVIDMCIDGEYHCQNEFREKYIFSPHKRRIEVEGRKNRSNKPKGKYIFDERPCEHGVVGQKDYRMRKNPDYIDPNAPKIERDPSQPHQQNLLEIC